MYIVMSDHKYTCTEVNLVELQVNVPWGSMVPLLSPRTRMRVQHSVHWPGFHLGGGQGGGHSPPPY